MTDQDRPRWYLTDHVCRHCLGRVLERVNPVPVIHSGEFRCSSCGTSAFGAPQGVCGCGIKTPGSARSVFRCAPNPHPGPTNPSEIIIMAGEVPAEIV